MTQSNLLHLHRALAEDSEDDRHIHLRTALKCGVEAITIFVQIGHDQYQQHVIRQLQSLRNDLGAAFDDLWAELELGQIPEWLNASTPQPPAPGGLEALQARLAAAGVTDDESLRQALESDPELAQAYQAFLAANPALVVQSLIGALLQVRDAQALVAFWQQVPPALEDPLISAAEAMLAQATAQGDENLVAALGPRLDGLRQIRDAQRAQADPAQQAFQAALQTYLELVQAAESGENSVEAWQAATAAGEALLAPELAETPGVNWEALRANLASTYTSLTIALEKGRAYDESLTATDRAIALQPNYAMWRRNRTGTLIDLGRLDEAAEELERARKLEPDAPRLADLTAALERARNPAPAAEEPSDGQ
jgi:tetratricopeptide (TPR) repeat protein